MTKPRPLAILAVMIVPALVGAQIAGRITFGRIAGVERGGESRKDQTVFKGSADGLKETGRVSAYRGNVTISFPDSNVVLTADEVIYNEETKEMSVSGQVRLKLDTK